jgi:hypothetical protein
VEQRTGEHRRGAGRLPSARPGVLRDLDPKACEPTAAVVVEIVWPGDESSARLGFYFARKVDELLIVDSL